MPNKNKITEREIIQAIQSGNFEHFDELVNRYTDYVFRVSMKMIRQAEDAEDCLQETFLKLFRSIKSYNSSSKFSTWLYRVTVNTCLDKIRKAGKTDLTTRLELEKTILPGSESRFFGDPEKQALTRELQFIVRKAIDSLPKGSRQTVILADLEKLSYPEAARKMGITLPAFKSRLRRARLIIKSKIAEYIQS